jgi:hypothetical protein
MPNTWLSLHLHHTSTIPHWLLQTSTYIPHIYCRFCRLCIINCEIKKLYGFETLSLKSRDEHRLRVFENRVLRRIFVPKWDEILGDWRQLHSEELYNLYSSSHIIRMIKPNRSTWAGYVACVGGEHRGFW